MDVNRLVVLSFCLRLWWPLVAVAIVSPSRHCHFCSRWHWCSRCSCGCSVAYGPTSVQNTHKCGIRPSVPYKMNRNQNLGPTETGLACYFEQVPHNIDVHVWVWDGRDSGRCFCKNHFNGPTRGLDAFPFHELCFCCRCLCWLSSTPALLSYMDGIPTPPTLVSVSSDAHTSFFCCDQDAIETIHGCHHCRCFRSNCSTM